MLVLAMFDSAVNIMDDDLLWSTTKQRLKIAFRYIKG